jgi:hypothetical protein
MRRNETFARKTARGQVFTTPGFALARAVRPLRIKHLARKDSQNQSRILEVGLIQKRRSPSLAVNRSLARRPTSASSSRPKPTNGAKLSAQPASSRTELGHDLRRMIAAPNHSITSSASAASVGSLPFLPAIRTGRASTQTTRARRKVGRGIVGRHRVIDNAAANCSGDNGSPCFGDGFPQSQKRPARSLVRASAVSVAWWFADCGIAQQEIRIQRQGPE